jgi:hypothetical protein
VALAAPAAVLLLSGAQGRRRADDPWLLPLDLSDPDRPKAGGELPVKNAANVALSDDGRLACVFVTGSPLSLKGLPKPAGLRFVDVSDPAKPKLVAALDVNGVSAMLLAGGLAYVGTRHLGKKEPAALHVYDVSQPAPPAPRRHPRTPAAARLPRGVHAGRPP